MVGGGGKLSLDCGRTPSDDGGAGGVDVEAVGDARLLALHGVMLPLARSIMSAGGAIGGGVGGDRVADHVTGECATGDADGMGAVVVFNVDDPSSRLVVVMVRALLVSPRVSVSLVTPMVGEKWVCHVLGVSVVGGVGVAGIVMVDGVGDVDGR